MAPFHPVEVAKHCGRTHVTRLVAIVGVPVGDRFGANIDMASGPGTIVACLGIPEDAAEVGMLGLESVKKVMVFMKDIWREVAQRSYVL